MGSAIIRCLEFQFLIKKAAFFGLLAVSGSCIAAEPLPLVGFGPGVANVVDYGQVAMGFIEHRPVWRFHGVGSWFSLEGSDRLQFVVG
ncbi:MAG: hypothetical protein M3A44_12475 [Gammaproteobacteria bacterium]